MTILRLVIGGFGLLLGYLCLAQPDVIWRLTVWINRRFGREVTRTSSWDARVPLAGVVLIGSGILFIIIAFVRMS